MAEKNAEAPVEEEGEVKPKKKGKLILIIAILVILGVGGGGAWWFIKGKKPADGKGAAHKTVDESKPPLYTQLDKEMTTGLTKTDAEDHYLQVEIKMKISDEHVAEKIAQRVPEIRSALLLLLTSKSAEDLKTVEDKQRLATEMAALINKIIHSTDPKVDGVLGVYFTTFILQ